MIAPDRLSAFLADLTALTKLHKLMINDSGCGCCGSTEVIELEDNTPEAHYWSKSGALEFGTPPPPRPVWKIKNQTMPTMADAFAFASDKPGADVTRIVDLDGNAVEFEVRWRVQVGDA